MSSFQICLLQGVSRWCWSLLVLNGRERTRRRETLSRQGTTRSDGPRLIGNVAIEASLPRAPANATLAGFENHGGRTRLLPGAEPLGRVIRGHGNDGRAGDEGCRSGNVIGTYLHGPLLPANSWFADWLITTALGAATPLAPLDDALELEAHRSACRAAGLSG